MEAAETAESAAKELEAKATQLDSLKKETKEKADAVVEAKKKSAALEKLKGAEDALVKDLENKKKAAEDAKNSADSTLKEQTDKANDAKSDAEKAGQAAADAATKSQQAQASAADCAKKMTAESAIVDTDKSERSQLAAKVKEASHIEIPAGSTVDEAHRQLDKHKNDVEKYTKQLLDSISKEKEALNKKHQMEGDCAKAKTDATAAQITAQQNQAAADAAKTKS